jgi:hypothetical protein
MRGLALAGAVLATALALTGKAEAFGGNYVFVGGSDAAQEAARAALEASRFDWRLVAETITIRITNCGCAGSAPGEIVLDENVLTGTPFGPMFAWGIVQHEYAHQLAFLPDARSRRLARSWLGGSDWCYEDADVGHDDHTCERFASSLAWAYWPWRRNIMAAEAVVSPAEFRSKVGPLLGLLDRRRPTRLLPSRRLSPTLRQAL